MLNSLASLQWLHEGGPADAVAALALRALADGELQTADTGFLDIGACQVLTWTEHPEAAARWQDSIGVAHRRGSLFAISGLHMWNGQAQLYAGDLDDADDSLAAAAREFVLYGYSNNATLYLEGFRAQLELERGDLAAARHALREEDPSDVPTDGSRYRLGAEIAVRLAEGRDEDVLAAVDRYEREYAGLARNPVSIHWRGARARALSRLGRADEALAEIDAELEVARGFGAPGTVARSLRTRGELLGDDGLTDLEEAAAISEHSTARMQHARALASLGSALRRSRRPTDAREPLRRALELAETCGSPGLAAAVRSELQAAGVRPRRGALKGVGSLTASERRVAGLAAEGRTNREIAQELFVTPKTVEVHLGNAYRKLEVRSRRDLEGVLSAA